MLHAESKQDHSGAFLLSPGEIHFLWWFIQGSIMNPFTRNRLRKAWGLCERHAWGWMVVEAAFRDAYMHGPAVLYEDVMELAVAAFEMRGPIQMGRLRRRLRKKGPCLMCEEGYGPLSKGFVKPHIVLKGQDVTQFKLLAHRTRPYWIEAVCGTCANTASVQRCRKHLIADIASGLVTGTIKHHSLVEDIFHHIKKYARSFQYEFQETRTDMDEGGLIKAVGWCSGWNTFLFIIGEAMADLGGTPSEQLSKGGRHDEQNIFGECNGDP